MSSGSIQSVLQETRVFNPPAEFAKAAHVSSMEQYQQIWDEAKADPEAFWAKVGTDMIDWFQPFEKTLDWSKAPFAEWYVGGKLNAAPKYRYYDAQCLYSPATADRRASRFPYGPG